MALDKEILYILTYSSIFCMEIFSQIINREVSGKNWKPLKIGSCNLSHLLFADDDLIFARADHKSTTAIHRALNLFLNCSSLVVNRDKSSILFSKNTPLSDKSLVLSTLGFRASSSLDNYLGFPLGINQRISDFRPIVDKVANKIEPWKSKNLSFWGENYHN